MCKLYTIIVACGENGVIGKDNEIPWYLPEDLKRFRKITTGHDIIMGSKTAVSIGKSLPKRRNIVVTSGKTPLPEGSFEVAITVDHAISLTKDSDEPIVPSAL